ncbi:MAG: di-trans,poly-cis-decaprenylcistransferase [Neptuniibacter caesariensis]|uniref:Ditrans,polycis-undecaprenyl-diphosphate synthase ((2E,6E)-farnesyl-diphosphate specific) n=1 Tax=Neptuniibacter caesariensis TaxID=207954 RepID=A0A2G6JNL0_NEPCE|nr:MAG: di-trans,poly-cis-decaprenylcistransferase [Neptuniibacter caesariensis]
MSSEKYFVETVANIPKHIAIIMDGNNRWAKERRLPGLAGHKAGVDCVRSVIEGCMEMGVEVLTLFAFSSENWKRPPLEVKGLMELFKLALDREAKKLVKNNIRLRVIGDKTAFSKSLQEKIRKVEEMTAECDGLNLNVAANYGGRWDIVSAAQSLAQRCKEGVLQPEEITEELLAKNVSLADLPEPDLCIRTGGEQRISNFLIWQFAYTELYFSDAYWPDFDKEHLKAAIVSYAGRQRRFGKTSEQVEAEGNA